VAEIFQFVPEPMMSLDEFCAAEHISRSNYYQITLAGYGPDFIRVGRSRRITALAYRDWQQRVDAMKDDPTSPYPFLPRHRVSR
jgi:hypothetical protein